MKNKKKKVAGVISAGLLLASSVAYADGCSDDLWCWIIGNPPGCECVVSK